MQHNWYSNSITKLSLSQTHAPHGKIFWKHRIGSSGQENRSSSSHSLSASHEVHLYYRETHNTKYSIKFLFEYQPDTCPLYFQVEHI